MYRIILFVFVLFSLTFLLGLQSVHAQDHFGRIEAFLALGRHVVLNDNLDPPVPGSRGYGSYRLFYHLTETQSIGLHYGGTRYDSDGLDGGDEEWVDDFYATYRHSWRKRQPLRIYFEVGLGVSDAIPPYDTGSKPALAFAIGIKRFIGQHFSMSLESRGVGFTQKKNEDADEVMAINEFTLVLGYLF